MDYAVLLEKIEAHVRNLYQENASSALHYHNITHVQDVMEAAIRLADHYQLNEEERFIVFAAVWFHDIGYLEGPAKQHEERSSKLAQQWLHKKGVSESIISKILGCIMATEMPQKPEGLLQQIICDSDLWQLGTEKFIEKHKLLRQEMADAHGKEIDSNTWRNGNIKLLESHFFHTDFARLLLQSGQEAHLQRLKRKSAEAEHGDEEKKDKHEDHGHKTDKHADLPTRGIETMFRVTMNNHMELSSMADSKANIMISVNSIIVSVVLSVLVRRLEEYPNLIWPTVLLLTVNVLTIIFAILSVRPNLMGGVFTEGDIRDKNVNLLFFGNFHKMPLEQYEWGMNEMMKDRDFLYGSMIRDIYYLGVVLGKKYKMLRYAYNIFMFGFVLTVVAFGISLAL